MSVTGVNDAPVLGNNNLTISEGQTVVLGSGDLSGTDIDNPVTREFCADSGTHLLAKGERMPGALMLKTGTLDDPSIFESPQMAIFTVDLQPFHQVPDGIPTVERGPGG